MESSSFIHCTEAAPEARCMLFMIRRSFDERSVSAFTSLYNSVYAVRACSENPVVDADRLEQLQRLATRLVKVFVGCHMRKFYFGWVRTKKTVIASMETSYIRAAYNVFSGGLDLDHSLLFIQPVRPGLRVHHLKVL